MRKPLILTVILCLLCLTAMAGAATETDLGLAPSLSLRDAGLTLGIHSVRYPQVEGLENSDLEEKINSLIQQRGRIAEYSARLPLVMSGAMPLTVDWSGMERGEILSLTLHAEGPLTTTRREERYSAVNVDLRTGEKITLQDLFTPGTDPEAALSQRLAEIGGTLSAHLLSGALQPLPEVFSLSATGVTLYYPAEQFRFLNDRAGVLHLSWAELPELDLSAGSPALRMGAEEMLTLTHRSRELLAEAVQGGALPDVPAAIGEDLAALAERWGLETDPDFYRDGRYVRLTGGCFRGVLLMTDRLREKDLTGSLVQGVRLDRGCLYGLRVGETRLEDWRACLGEPDASVDMDWANAEEMRLTAGTSDYYLFGRYRLRLHADGDGILRTIMLLP